MAPDEPSTRPMTDPAEQRQAKLLQLVQADYEATRAFIDSVVLTATAIRSVGVTIALAFLGYAVAHSSFAVALSGLVAAVLFLFLDAYHGWIYDQARRRVRRIERILRLRYRQLEAGDDEPEAEADLNQALAAHAFGQYLALDRFELKALRSARPRPVYVGLYGSLILAAVVASIYSAAT
jgi:uncharacterized membrane protein